MNSDAVQATGSEGASSSNRWSPRSIHLLHALIAIAAVQLVYWLLVYPAIFSAGQRPHLIDVDDTGVATLIAPSTEALQAADFKPVDLPWSDCCEIGYRALRFSVTLDVVPEDGLAIIPIAGVDNLAIVVNGQMARQEGRMTLPDITYHGNLKSISYISPGLLHAGANRFAFIMVRDSVPYFDVNRPLVGRYAQTRALFEKRNYLLNEYQLQSYTIAFLLALLAAVLCVRSEQKAFAVWTLVLVLAWALRMHYFRWVDPPFSGDVRVFYYFSLTALMPAAWVNVADSWTGRPLRWLSEATMAVTMLSLGVMAYAMFAMPSGGFDLCASLSNTLGLLFGAATIARFVWHLLRVRDDRHWEAAIFLLCITLMAVEFIWQGLWDISTGHLQNSLPLLLTAFAVAFFARNVRLFRSMNEINALLNDRLQQRETELAQHYARQGALLRRETLVNERHRLMRDMHDGIGGQLMSLLHTSRLKPIPQTELSENLSNVVDELRLIIDSLDSVGNSIGTALASFRRRLEPTLTAAGIRLIWSNTLDDQVAHLGPREVLQVFRIVQEAVTNAIRHAHSATLRIAISSEATPTPLLHVVIADQGSGMDKHSSGGHGLKNMQARAESIGASLSTQSSPDGTEITLTLPLEKG